MAAPVSSTVVDASSASLMPFIDEDLGLLYLAGKGEGGINKHAKSFLSFSLSSLFFLFCLMLV